MKVTTVLIRFINKSLVVSTYIWLKGDNFLTNIHKWCHQLALWLVKDWYGIGVVTGIWCPKNGCPLGGKSAKPVYLIFHSRIYYTGVCDSGIESSNCLLIPASAGSWPSALNWIASHMIIVPWILVIPLRKICLNVLGGQYVSKHVSIDFLEGWLSSPGDRYRIERKLMIQWPTLEYVLNGIYCCHVTHRRRLGYE